MYEDVLELIRDYQARAAEACRRLRSQLGIEGSILGAWNRGEIPAAGVLQGEPPGEFLFHGIGCRVQFGPVVVDFDFGPGGRADGFDAWRLHLFARSVPDRYEEFRELDAVRAHLDMLKVAGIVFFPEWFPGEHLYYLTASEPDGAHRSAEPRSRSWPVPPSS